MPLRIHRIATVDRADLEPYRTLKRPLEHQKKGIFVAEGETVVRRLFDSPLRVRSVLLTPEWFAVYSPHLEARKEVIDVFIAGKNSIESIVGFPLHKGIMALADIPPPATAAEVARSHAGPLFFVAVDGIMNAENLGVIVRNCASFGVDALLVGETSCDPYLRRAVRNSMGNIFRLPVVYLQNITEDLAGLRAAFTVQLIAAHPRAESKPIGTTDLTGNCCIILGSEGTGVSPPLLSICDQAITIPMRGGVDSLNVGSASAVILYEVQRQRTAKR